MKTKLLLTLALVVAATGAAFAQNGGTAQAAKSKNAVLDLLAFHNGLAELKINLVQNGAAQPAKTKIAVIDVLAFREAIGELKVKYDKLQTEFAPRYRELESMQSSLAAKEKVLSESKTLTQQQGLKLQQELEEGKRAYQRLVEDSQATAGKREEEETGPIKEKLGKFLEQYCQKLGIAFVFDGRQLQETGLVIYADGKANITEDFIKEYNKAYPAPAGAASNK